MTELTLDVRLDGFAEPAGVLVRDQQGALAFVYTAAHLAQADALPLSLSMPLTDEPYDDVAARAFFDNLLQERDGALTDVMAREGLSRDDVAGLLLHLGKDCAGALSVLPAGAPPVKVPGNPATDYRPLNENKLIAIVTALRDRRRLPEGTTDPSPLAGVQSKIALTRLPDGQFAEPLPGSGAPTTHILKVPDRDHPRDAAYEAATLDLSRTLGCETSDALVVDIGGIEALLVRRFDRALDGQGCIVRLIKRTLRRHWDYRRHSNMSVREAMSAASTWQEIRKVLDATANPIDARDRFIRAVLFDLMTGNVDNHAKNFAILHTASTASASPPRYDLASNPARS